MIEFRKLAAVWGAASVALVTLSGAVLADGYEEYSAPPPPVEEGRKFTYSFNLAGTNDYIFRGYSQSARDPVPQGGADITYGMLYLGVWASGIDFGGSPPTGLGEDAQVEIDWYGGITPTWGPATFNFGVIYYNYPGAGDFLTELDYVELKAGVSGTLHQNLTTGITVYWSPEYTAETGSVWTIEGAAGYEFHKVHIFTPSITGVLGYQTGDEAAWKALFANGDDNYLYWNAGLVLAVDNISFDFRYWDTNVSNSNAALGTTNFCNGALFQCDGAFVFTAKVAVP
jgi:uncharacterized protein (TIGR02001 family)